MNIKAYKMRPEAKLPTRAHKTDAGIDFYYCPNVDKKLYNTQDFYIPPKASRLLSTGIKVEIPDGYMLEIKN